MTAMIFSELPLVMIKFVTDDLGFRCALHGAVARGECPDYARADRSTGKSVTAFGCRNMLLLCVPGATRCLHAQIRLIVSLCSSSGRASDL